MTAAPSRGFTLLEVMVALAISALAVAAAHGLFGMVAVASERLPEMARAEALKRNRERTVRQLLAQVETGTDRTRWFEGGATSARFDSWCPAPGGWQERCTVHLAFEVAADSIALRLSWGHRSEELWRGLTPIGLRYLDDAEGALTVRARWGRSLAPPLAVVAVTGPDTLILRIGRRG